MQEKIKKINDDTLLERSGGMDVDPINRLLGFCLTTAVFKYKGMHYQQPYGVVMESPVSPVIDGTFTEELEHKVFEMKNSQDFNLS